MSEISLFVKKHSARITPAVVNKLLPKLPLLKAEFTQINAPQFPHLIDQLEFLASVVEDFAEGADLDIPYGVVADAAFAVLYAHKKVDLIPDSVPEFGHADDSVIVRTVLVLNEKEFASYAARHQMKWAAVTSQP
jgi:uncharacterized membrane protein YkvA (DUF1232 family)